MSRWAEAFAALSGAGDTLDTMRHSAKLRPTASQSANSVTAAPAPFEPAVPSVAERAPGVWGQAEEKRAAITEYDRAMPRIGIPEIPEQPVLLRDGRRLWRFSQGQDCSADRALALIDQAHWCGAVLVADGRELIVVERWLSTFPPETLRGLKEHAAEVIAVLLGRRGRCDGSPRKPIRS